MHRAPWLDGLQQSFPFLLFGAVAVLVGVDFLLTRDPAAIGRLPLWTYLIAAGAILLVGGVIGSLTADSPAAAAQAGDAIGPDLVLVPRTEWERFQAEPAAPNGTNVAAPAAAPAPVVAAVAAPPASPRGPSVATAEWIETLADELTPAGSSAPAEPFPPAAETPPPPPLAPSVRAAPPSSPPGVRPATPRGPAPAVGAAIQPPPLGQRPPPGGSPSVPAPNPPAAPPRVVPPPSAPSPRPVPAPAAPRSVAGTAPTVAAPLPQPQAVTPAARSGPAKPRGPATLPSAPPVEPRTSEPSDFDQLLSDLETEARRAIVPAPAIARPRDHELRCASCGRALDLTEGWTSCDVCLSTYCSDCSSVLASAGGSLECPACRVGRPKRSR